MGNGQGLRNCRRHFCELGSRGVTDKGSSRVRLFAGRRPSEGRKLNQTGFDVNKVQDTICKTSRCSRSSACSDCAHYIKEIAKLKRAFIQADDENIRCLMQYEDKISKFNAEKKWLETDVSSEKLKEKAGVRIGCRASF